MIISQQSKVLISKNKIKNKKEKENVPGQRWPV